MGGVAFFILLRKAGKKGVWAGAPGGYLSPVFQALCAWPLCVSAKGSETPLVLCAADSVCFAKPPRKGGAWVQQLVCMEVSFA